MEVWSLSIKNCGVFYSTLGVYLITTHFLCHYKLSHCLPTCLSYSPFECLPACRSDCLSHCLWSVPMVACLCVFLFVCLPVVFLPVCLPVCLSVCSSACLSASLCLPVFASSCPPFSQFVSLFVCPPACLLFVPLPVCLCFTAPVNDKVIRCGFERRLFSFHMNYSIIL